MSAREANGGVNTERFAPVSSTTRPVTASARARTTGVRSSSAIGIAAASAGGLNAPGAMALAMP